MGTHVHVGGYVTGESLVSTCEHSLGVQLCTCRWGLCGMINTSGLCPGFLAELLKPLEFPK